jgi:hypothetical protein
MTYAAVAKYLVGIGQSLTEQSGGVGKSPGQLGGEVLDCIYLEQPF